MSLSLLLLLFGMISSRPPHKRVGFQRTEVVEVHRAGKTVRTSLPSSDAAGQNSIYSLETLSCFELTSLFSISIVLGLVMKPETNPMV